MQNYSEAIKQFGLPNAEQKLYEELPDKLCLAVLLSCIQKNVMARDYGEDKAKIVDSLLDLIDQINPRIAVRCEAPIENVGVLAIVWAVVPISHKPEIAVPSEAAAKIVIEHYDRMKQCMAICYGRLKQNAPEIFDSLELLEGSPFTLKETQTLAANKCMLYTYETWAEHLGLISGYLEVY